MGNCGRCRGVCKNDYDLCIYECECHPLEDAISRFPKFFGLRAYPEKVFRIGVRQSFVSEGEVKLYTQCLFSTAELPRLEQRGHDPHGFTWLDFAKGTEAELAGQLAPVPERWTEIVAREV